MKQLIITTFLILFFMNGAIAKSRYIAGAYKIDSDHSKVALEVTTLKIPTPHGSFTQIDGRIDLKENFQDSKIHVLVDIAPTEAFPEMKFVSQKIIGTLDSFDLIGKLTIRGITEEVTFKSHYIGVVNDGFGTDKAAFIGTTKIQLEGEEVTIDLRILANRPSKSTASIYQEVQEIVQ